MGVMTKVSMRERMKRLAGQYLLVFHAAMLLEWTWDGEAQVWWLTVGSVRKPFRASGRLGVNVPELAGLNAQEQEKDAIEVCIRAKARAPSHVGNPGTLAHWYKRDGRDLK